MCGILGTYLKYASLEHQKSNFDKALQALENRGPDNQSIFQENSIILGHTRLSIIDTSPDGHQPMMDSDKELIISYNGEFYNFEEEKVLLEAKGYSFKSKTDTEVLLYMYKAYGPEFVKRVNGCFAIAIYDQRNDSLFLARDRFGIKPLFFSDTEDKFIFASEIKAIIPQKGNISLEPISLHQYFRFNYNPLQSTCIEGIRKLEPGHYYQVKGNKIDKHKYYQIPYTKKYRSANYDDAQKEIRNLVDKAVQKRMVSDVPLGTFLSGGVDSSIISTIAKKYSDNLNTFSIGFEDEPLFDETKYAELVAKKIGSHHHTFSLKNKDLFDHLFEILDYLDEPFADSSVIPVYILSKETRKHVKVALSGDGADEIFSGYNKHSAHFRALNPGLKEALIKNFGAAAQVFPKSRNSNLGNVIRQADKFHKGLNISDQERYIKWLSINDRIYADELLKHKVDKSDVKQYENMLSQYVDSDMNDILYSDTQFLLPNDMLYKVDKMSMANSLEVRTPFLDHELVDYVFSLEANYKISNKIKKRILQDSYKEILPQELYNRSKHGFEVPLLKWFRTDLHDYLFEDLFRKDKIIRQNILNFSVIEGLKKKLFSTNPEDSVASIWALLVFQYWYDKHFDR